MTTRSDRLDPDLLAALGGTGGEVTDQALSLVTVGDDGAPNLALISSGEVLAVDDRTLRLALWRSSRTTANLNDRRHGSLAFVVADAFVTIDVETPPAEDATIDENPIAVVQARVVSVRWDRVPYAELTSGITFRLLDDSVRDRWTATKNLLRGR